MPHKFRRVNLRHDNRPGAIVSEIIEAKLGERHHGRSLYRVRMGPHRFRELSKEVEDPTYVHGVHVMAQPGVIFEIDSVPVTETKSSDWK